ncbi:ribonuclease R [Mycoplasma sp. 4463]|uniref:ribonuclease R n=1 Tax=Mycoplasma sp. 4463 TaxID=3400998 RepID=UPI003AB05F86
MQKQEILNYIRKYKSRSFLDIAKHFKVSLRNNKDLTKAISDLQSEYLVFRNNNDEYYSPELEETVTGILKVATKGNFGFVDYDINEEEGTKKSVYVKTFNFNGAISGDEVKVNVYKLQKGDEELKDGVVTQIIQRNNESFVGFIKEKNGVKSFAPIDARFKSVKFKLIPSSVPNKLNDLVLAKVLAYEDKFITISVERVITNEADPMVFVKSYLEQIKVPSAFPENTEDEIKLIPETIDNEDQTNRRDFTNEMIVTIDGDDTKDFDDAITVKKLDNGNYFLGVYIADVSHYVKEGSFINQEALSRGTSIYLVDRVIPMLPVELSNGICSLNPNVKRFVLACEMEIDKNGNTVRADISQGVIESKFRLTYKQVDKYYNTGEINEDHPNQENVAKLKQMLNVAKELSLIIHDYKIKEGYVDFDIDEPKIKLDQYGSVEQIMINKRGFSEVLIEDFMVRANETVAKYLFDAKLPVLYRVHEAPDEDKIQLLQNSLAAVSIDASKLKANSITPKIFADFVNKVKAERDDDFIKLMFLRSMQKAIYSDVNIGHFGLASEYYCHFTSPIRRYPDLIIHRIIRDFIINKQTEKLEEFRLNLPVFGDLNTKSEQKAVQIERNVNDLKFAEFLKNKIGSPFRAQILSVLNFGFFVEFDFKASGLVHKSTLIDGEYEANENLTKLISKDRKFTIGDFVDVIVTEVDLVEGKVTCVLADLYEAWLAKKQKEEAERASKNKQNFSKLRKNFQK